MNKDRKELYALLGKMPPESEVIVKSVTNNYDYSYDLEHLVLNLDGINETTAYFAKPKNSKPPFKTILFNHSHGGNYALGKDELLKGNVYLQLPSYAKELTEMGYAVFCFDAWGFGSRSVESEGSIFKRMLWNGEVMWGRMVYDSIKAIDYLVSREDVTNEIATIGMSMGGVMSWWLSALDERVSVCVDICGMVEFDSLLEAGNLDDHGIYFYVPNLVSNFTTSEINKMIFPRPHLSLVGKKDQLTPKKGLNIVDENLSKYYLENNRQGYWEMYKSNKGHFETKEMRETTKNFLIKWFNN